MEEHLAQSTADIAAETKEAAEQAAKAVAESAKANTDAVETAGETREALKEAAKAVTQSAEANTEAVAQAAASGEAKREAPEAGQESMADYSDAIDRSMRRLNEGDIVTGTVIAISEDDATLDLQNYAAGVIRKGDFSADPKFSIIDDVRIGDTLTARVKRTDDGHGNLLLSVKEAAQILAWDKLLDAMKEKKPVTVRISEAVKAGVLCYPEGLRAFIPASKLSLSFVDEKELPSYVGRTIEAQVITCDQKENKLVLSARELLRAEREKERARKISNVEVGLVTEGVVETLTDFGAFVNLGNDLTGLVHVSQIARERIAHPSAVLKKGDKVKVKVIAVKDGKLSLSMKEAAEEEAVAVSEEEVPEYHSEGTVSTSLADLLKKAGF